MNFSYVENKASAKIKVIGVGGAGVALSVWVKFLTSPLRRCTAIGPQLMTPAS